MVSIVDRKTGYLWLKKCCNRKSDEILKTTIELLSPMKRDLKTITADNGKEFSLHAQIAKELEIDLDDENFKQELNDLITEDFHVIENYMNLIMSSAVTLSENSEKSLNAILNKDIDSLNDIYKKMLNLEKEVKNLNDKLFVDDITNTFNKKWIYKKFLNENALFQQNGICVLVDVIDYNYIQKEYGELLANNLLIFATKFIKQKLKDEDFKYEMVRYNDNKFLIFIENISEQERNVVNFVGRDAMDIKGFFEFLIECIPKFSSYAMKDFKPQDLEKIDGTDRKSVV